MSLRDFNGPSADNPAALHNSPQGNGAGLNAFHTVNPEDREPSHLPQIIGGVAVALMVGVAAIGLYAYSGPSKPKPAVADNHLPSPPAPVAPPPTQQAAMTPDTTTPADSMSQTKSMSANTPSTAPAADMTKPDSSEPVKSASAGHSRHHHIALSSDSDRMARSDETGSGETVRSRSTGADRMARSGETGAVTAGTSERSSSQEASVQGTAGQQTPSGQTTGQTAANQQAPSPQQTASQQTSSQQPAGQQTATPLPAAPQPSPSDVANNNSQSSTAVPGNATTASDMPATTQPGSQPQPSAPAAPAQEQQTAPQPAQ